VGSTKRMQSPSRKKIVVSLCWVLAASVFIVLGFQEIRLTNQLVDNGQCAEDTVTASRIMHSRRQTFEIKYTFQVPGSDSFYTHSDAAGRTDLWFVLPEDQWRLATSKGHLRIRYASSNPGNNAPASAPPNYLDPWAGVGLGATIVAIVALCWFKGRKE